MDEPMTDFQFKALLKMVLEILKSSKSIEDAIAKVEALVDEGKNKEHQPIAPVDARDLGVGRSCRRSIFPL